MYAFMNREQKYPEDEKATKASTEHAKEQERVRMAQNTIEI